MSEWTDEDGRPLGSWVEIGRDEWWPTIEQAGGLKALAVFSSLTDPEGVYGPAQIYTAWGRREDDAPLVDICDFKADDGTTERQVCRKFAPAAWTGTEKPHGS